MPNYPAPIRIAARAVPVLVLSEEEEAFSVRAWMYSATKAFQVPHRDLQSPVVDFLTVG
jgi:hypothetical protein